MSSNVESAQIDLPAHIGSGQVLHVALVSLWRRKFLVLGIVVVAVALGMVAVAVMPARYTAEAYIRGEFTAAAPGAREDNGTNVSGTSLTLDLVRVIETHSRLLQSHQVARRVVHQLGLERLQPIVSKRQWLPAAFKGVAIKTPASEEDIAATRLLYGLSVESDPRAYLIKVEYIAGDPELADLVATAFVVELLRSTKLQMLFQHRATAAATLARQLAKFGDKHPGIAQARVRLASLDDLLEKQLSETPDSILQDAGENVTSAVAAPSSPKATFVIVLLLILGLLAGGGVALWLERARWWSAFSRYHAEPFA